MAALTALAACGAARYNTANLLVVNPGVKANTVAELIALARKSPGPLTFASADNGCASHLSGEFFKTLAGVDMVHVPYKGSAPAMTDFLGDRVAMMFDTASNFVEHVTAGKLRPLGVTSRKRLQAMPGVPSIAETEDMDGYDISLWLGVLAPAGTPKDILARLQREIAAVMSTPEMAKQMADAGIEVRVNTPQEFVALIRADLAKWAGVVKRAGMQLD